MCVVCVQVLEHIIHIISQTQLWKDIASGLPLVLVVFSRIFLDIVINLPFGKSDWKI